MHELRVVQIAKPNVLTEYPECADDTTEFPHLIPYVEDDMEIFVIDPAKPTQFWPAKEFFFMVDVKRFMVDAEEWARG